MTEPSSTTPVPPENTPTEPLQLADQQPIEAPTAAPARSNTHVILGVVAGAVAVGLIVASGIAGFAIGHFTADNGDHGRFGTHVAIQGGAEADGPGMMPGQGQGMQPGYGDDRGPGDGHGRGMLPGQGALPGQGIDPRGIDPDGDNWTGGPGQDQGTLPTIPQPQSSASPSGA